MTAIEIENISKQYALGKIGSGTLYRDLNVLWARMRGKSDPYLKIGQVNDRTQKADGDYVWALQNINLKIEEGEVVGIIGSNGAGKSTLLKILSRVTTPTTGRITTYGRIASLLEVGTGFHQEMTGRENIYMNGSIMGMTRAEITRKLDEIVDFAGVEKYIDTPVKRYSSGMNVRLGFAVAAFLEPEILVVDEVLTVGDAEFQKKAIGKMNDVAHEGGRTVLFVSHNMAAVRSLCSRGVVLSCGQQVFDGDTTSAVDFYLANNEAVSEGLMKDQISQKSDNIQIYSISINGQEGTNLIITSGQETITLRIEGRTSDAFTGNVKMYLRNTNGTPLATLAESTYKGSLIHFKEGNFVIEKIIKLPKYINHGIVILDLLLYNKSIHYFRAARMCKLDIMGNCDALGQPLNVEFEGLYGLETQ